MQTINQMERNAVQKLDKLGYIKFSEQHFQLCVNLNIYELHFKFIYPCYCTWLQNNFNWTGDKLDAKEVIHLY